MASLAVSLFTLTCLVFLCRLLYLAVNTPRPVSHYAPSGAAAVVTLKKAEAMLKPGRSCGHCGVRIKGDPIRGIALDEQNFLVYGCPQCKKETLLPQ